MAFETRHYVIIGIAILVVILLWSWGRKEGFSVIPEWPSDYLPPKYWTPTESVYWDPWYYHENDSVYYPTVPKVVNYDTRFYKFPATNCTQYKKYEKPVITQPPCYKAPVMQEMPHVEGFNPAPTPPTITQEQVNDNLSSLACGGCMRCKDCQIQYRSMYPLLKDDDPRLNLGFDLDAGSSYINSCRLEGFDGNSIPQGLHRFYSNLITPQRKNNLGKLVLFLIIFCGIFIIVNKK